jgi:hypothetical protein
MRAIWSLSVLALLVPVSARAQRVATSLDELKYQIRIGETIYVTDSAGTTIKGKLRSLSNSSVEIRMGPEQSAPPLRLAETDVNNIVVERFDPIWNLALVGLAIGAGAGTLIELAGKTEYQKFSGSGAISLGTLTLVTGLLIDVFNREKVTVYVHSPAP